MNISIPKQKEAEIINEVLGGGGYCEFNVPVLGPCLQRTILGSVVKTAPSSKAVLLSRRIFAEAELIRIWTNQS